MATKQATLSRLSPASAQAGSAYTAQMGLGTYAMGSSDDALSQAAYSSSPIHDGTVSDVTIATTFKTELVGNQDLNVDFPGGISMDYSMAPLIDDSLVDTEGNKIDDGGGMPMGPRVPTTASPADESTNAIDIPYIVNSTIVGHGGENGSILSPAQTSRSTTLYIDEDGDGIPETPVGVVGIGNSAEAFGTLVPGKSAYTQTVPS